MRAIVLSGLRLLLICLWLVGVPVVRAESSASVVRDLTYKVVDQAPLQLDIYRPASSSAAGKMPVVIYLHGGSWYQGDKADIRDAYKGRMLDALLENGYAVVSVNYRLTSAARHLPMPIQDSKDAVRWVRKHSATYGLDPERIGVWGTSAGAHLGMLLAYSSDARFTDDPALAGCPASVSYVINNYGPVDLVSLFKPELPDVAVWLLKWFAPDKHEQRQARLQALTGLDPAVDKVAIRELLEAYSPLSYVGERAVPTLIFHGDADKTVPASQAESLKEALQRVGVPTDMVIYPGAGHGFRDMSPAAERDLLDRTVSFVRQHTVSGMTRSTEGCDSTL